MHENINWKGQPRFLVFGSGISGIAAAELLVKEQIEVVLYEENDKITKAMITEKSSLLDQEQIIIGTMEEVILAGIDIAVLSPGVPLDHPLVRKMSRQGIGIWGEIELAYAFTKGKIIAITGTNGKTTTTSLTGEIMKSHFRDIKVVGNIGIPFTGIAADTTEDTVVVAEISSFQLETIHRFQPKVSAILNITPDHLNRHHTMENYRRTKESITRNQGVGDVCVLNYEDEELRRFSGVQKAGVIYFSSKRQLKEGVYLAHGSIYISFANQAPVKLCQVSDLKLIGIHNYENVMAAVAIAHSFSVPLQKIRDCILGFSGVAHRIEYVTTIKGIRFYNDSKGTNPDAAIQAVRAMKWPTLLIGGGYDKDSEYEPWIESFHGKVKKLVLLGATKDKIAAAARKNGFMEIEFANNLEEAVRICFQNAQKGDAVLLSPACASWGMFKDYEERGNKFKEYIKELKE